MVACAGLVAVAQATYDFQVRVDNDRSYSRKDIPVVVDLKKQAPFIDAKSATVALPDGSLVACQLDDLNGDLVPDELAFLADVAANGSMTYNVIVNDYGTMASYPKRTRAYLKLRDDKFKHPEVTDIAFPWGVPYLDMYNSIYGHGAVLETEPVALRIYMDNRQSVDIYSKTTPQMELDTTGFYTTREQLAQGYGCDILWAGKSVGAGSFRGYQNGNPCYVDTVANRGQRIIVDGPVRSIAEVYDQQWTYNGHPVDMVQRYTMWGGHRDVEVAIDLKGNLASDEFCTGVQKLENDNQGKVNADGLAWSWGNNVPDKGAPDLVETVGLGVVVPAQYLASVKEDDVNYLTMLRPDANGRIRYTIAFCGGREKGGFTNPAQWTEYLTRLQSELQQGTKATVVENRIAAPFYMPAITVPTFAAKDFNIKKYGAKPGNVKATTKAFAKAMEACNKAGGGRVVVPEGEWLTGPIHFRSNVNLYLSEGAVVNFIDDPAAYLPAVQTSWEGMECFNYSPLVYAFECENIAISGPGTLAPKMDLWRTWFKRPQPHMDALKELYTMASTDVPVAERQMAQGENHLRPHLIHINRCKNVLLDGFKIRESPFWTIHLFLCDGVTARDLDVRAKGHNNDGIDIEMTRNVLVEKCKFDQGDDAVVIKSGRNRDAWRLATPTENVVVRDCEIVSGHVLLGIGSEISGGIRNVYMTRCSTTNKVMRMFYVKTNHRRGAFVENIYMDNCTAAHADRILETDPEVLYQWKTLVPTYERRLTKISGLHMKDIKVATAQAVYELDGAAELPVSDISMDNIEVGEVTGFTGSINNATDVSITNLRILKSSNEKLIPTWKP